jgi:hypothetical protein
MGWFLMSDQAIVFLSHNCSRRVLRHFRRLGAETQGLLSTFLCVHDPRQPDSRARRLLAFRDAELRRYDFVWLIEYDVDFAGNWRDFFLGTMGSKADFIGANIQPRHPEDDWPHWSWFRSPAEIPDDKHLRSFNPICRFSRRMIAVYVQAVQNDVWFGHTEALYPTIAWSHRLTISDLGGRGPFCPKELHGKNYHYDDGYRSGTFIHAPPVRNVYFHEKPHQFIRRNLLFHPVKVHAPLRARLKRYCERALEFGKLITHFGPKKC